MTLAEMTNAHSSSNAQHEAGKELILLCHAETEVRGPFCDYSNTQLSARGREDLPTIVGSLSAAFPSLNGIWSSDLPGAMETAGAIAQHSALDLVTSRGLREMNFGAWDGLTWNEIELAYPVNAHAWMERFPYGRPTKGEAFVQFQTRAINELRSLRKNADPGSTLIVTHPGFIRIAVAWVLGMSDKRIPRIAVNHGAITVVENVGEDWSVLAMNVNLCCHQLKRT